MGIPEARARLKELARRMPHHLAQELNDIVDEEMFRALPARRPAPKRLASLTPEQKEAIREYAHSNPEMSQLQIANFFGTNPGRVSEALHGK